MAKLSLDEVKAQKNFYRDYYRGVVVVLLFSLVLSFILVIVIIYSYLTQSLPAFYATDGVKSPIQLTPLEQPNMSETYLLPPDPPEEPMGSKDSVEIKHGR